MTILEDDEVLGLDDRRHRVGDAALASSLERCAKDQAALHREITGFDVPNAPGSDQATPHVHDGTDGVIIPIPIGWAQPFASVWRHADDSGTDQWAILSWIPIYCQTSRVRVYLRTRSNIGQVTDTTQVQSFLGTDLTSPTDTAQFRQVGASLRGKVNAEDVVTAYADVDVTAGEWNALAIRVWDGYYMAGGAAVPATRLYDTITVFPSTHVPGPTPQPWAPPTVTSTDVQTPDSRYPSESSSNAYTPLDSGMVGASRAVSSYIGVSSQMNDALLSEVLDGRPAGSNAVGHSNDASYAGHCHAGSTSDYDLCGADIVQPLVCASYGGDFNVFDTSNSRTRVSLPPLMPNNGSLTWNTVAQHRFRFPRVADSSGASTNIQAAAIVWAYPRSYSDSRVGAHIKDSAGAGGPGSRDASSTITAAQQWQMVTISNVDEADDTSERKLVRVEVESRYSQSSDPFRIAAFALAYIP